MSELTQERVKELFVYIGITGQLFNLTNRAYNAQKGDIAGDINSTGYRRVNVDGKRYLVHRVIWLYLYGEWPNGQIDHIDGDKLNNRLANLQVVSAQGNSRNSKRYSNNKSGVTGVMIDKGNKSNPFRAEICVNGINKFLGYANNLLDAVCLRKSAENKYNFHENHGRA